MKRRITLARARALFTYDKASGVLRWKKRPHAKAQKCAPGTRAGCESASTSPSRKPRPVRAVMVDGRKYLEHRLIWFLVKGAWPVKLDHEDTDATNNRWRNLREATDAQNNRNCAARRTSTTGLKWVRRKPNGFQASVQLYLGTYRSAAMAHQVAVRFVRKHHGEFFNPGANNGRGTSR